MERSICQHFAEQNWWEEDDFSSEGDGFKYEQIFSTRNLKTITEAQMLALFNQKMNEYLKISSQCAYEWMVYDEAYKQYNNWEIRIMRQSKANVSLTLLTQCILGITVLITIFCVKSIKRIYL